MLFSVRCFCCQISFVNVYANPRGNTTQTQFPRQVKTLFSFFLRLQHFSLFNEKTLTLETLKERGAKRINFWAKFFSKNGRLFVLSSKEALSKNSKMITLNKETSQNHTRRTSTYESNLTETTKKLS